MLDRLVDTLLPSLARVPGLYPLLAFATARRVVVRGWSMYPALAPSEHVLFDRLAYRLGPPRRGDVVLAYHPARPGIRIVKRVAARPGDAVAFAGGSCWVNGVPFSAEGEHPASAATAPPPPTLTLGEGEYLLLGDAADVSTDGRQLGPVPRGGIKARAWMVYWPPERMRRIRHEDMAVREEGQA